MLISWPNGPTAVFISWPNSPTAVFISSPSGPTAGFMSWPNALTAAFISWPNAPAAEFISWRNGPTTVFISRHSDCGALPPCQPFRATVTFIPAAYLAIIQLERNVLHTLTLHYIRYYIDHSLNPCPWEKVSPT